MITNVDSKIYLDLLFQYLKNNKKYLLLADSWSSNKNIKLFEEVFAKYEGQLKVKRLLIPKSTIGMIQPLDVYYSDHTSNLYGIYRIPLKYMKKNKYMKFGSEIITSNYKHLLIFNSRRPCFVTW